MQVEYASANSYHRGFGGWRSFHQPLEKMLMKLNNEGK